MAGARVREFQRFKDYRLLAEQTGVSGRHRTASRTSMRTSTAWHRNLSRNDPGVSGAERTTGYKIHPGSIARLALRLLHLDTDTFDRKPRTFCRAHPSGTCLASSCLTSRTVHSQSLASDRGCRTGLKLDDPSYALPRATGSSKYNFQFRPHSLAANIIEHREGQVEVDQVFVAQRNGDNVVFLVEADTEGQRLTREAWASLSPA
ncbi:hypothetical protein GGC64_002135 [Mycobacterium sp. OAS707]|nr:hypothetical protein [Mycobacterium sp. OAS707]